jgi:hypothetical protein
MTGKDPKAVWRQLTWRQAYNMIRANGIDKNKQLCWSPCWFSITELAACGASWETLRVAFSTANQHADPASRKDSGVFF